MAVVDLVVAWVQRRDVRVGSDRGAVSTEVSIVVALVVGVAGAVASAWLFSHYQPIIVGFEQ